MVDEQPQPSAGTIDGSLIDEQQRVCVSMPYCRCVGEVNEWNECDCTGNIAGCSKEVCEACGATLEVVVENEAVLEGVL